MTLLQKLKPAQSRAGAIHSPIRDLPERFITFAWFSTAKKRPRHDVTLSIGGDVTIGVRYSIAQCGNVESDGNHKDGHSPASIASANGRAALRRIAQFLKRGE